MVMCKTSSRPANYQAAIDNGDLAIAKGFELSDVDRARGWVIEKLMCDFKFDIDDFTQRFGALCTSCS